MSASRRSPGDTCAICNRPLTEVGGQRLIATNNQGISLRPAQDKLGTIHHPCRTLRLAEDHRDVIVVMWGNIWNENAVERVERSAQAGCRPWFCQRCVKHLLCTVCCYPMQPVAGADILHDNGKVGHVPLIAGMATQCENPQCKDSI